MKALIKQFRDKLINGAVIGPFCKTEDPALVETMGYAGFDFIILDLEHGPNNILSLQNLIRASQLTNMLPLVRIKEDHTGMIGEVLDAGAAGIQVPKITTSAEAELVVRKARFGKNGDRGVCRFVRAANYSSKDRFEYFEEANEAIIILQIEGTEAINNLNEIARVPGIDVIFIGPYDLSQSLGLPGQIDHPLVEAKMTEIVDTCKAHNKIVGVFADTVKNAAKWKQKGVNYIAYSVDMGIMYEKCKDIVQHIITN